MLHSISSSEDINCVDRVRIVTELVIPYLYETYTSTKGSLFKNLIVNKSRVSDQQVFFRDNYALIRCLLTPSESCHAKFFRV